MAEHVVPHFHNDPGVPVIEIGAKEFMCVGRNAAIRPSARLPRHGRGQRNHLPLLLDALSLQSGARSACGAPAGVRAVRFPPPPDLHRDSPTMAPPRHVIIAGAGIAGLTAALALARAGHSRDRLRAGREA